MKRSRSVFALVSCTLVTGCAVTATDPTETISSSSTAELSGPFQPRVGLLVAGELLDEGSTCGSPETWLPRNDFVAASSRTGYTRSIHLLPASEQPAPRLDYVLVGRTGIHRSETSWAPPAGSAGAMHVTLQSTDLWEDDSTVLRVDTAAYRCEGGACAWAHSSHPTLPCITTRVQRYTLARCGSYPFRHHAPSASSVWVTGSFNGWAKTPADGALELERGVDGEWRLDAALPDSLGRATYKFIVDGEWREDPVNPVRERNGLGGHNSVLGCR